MLKTTKVFNLPAEYVYEGWVIQQKKGRFKMKNNKQNQQNAVTEMFTNAPVIEMLTKKGKKEKEEIEFPDSFQSLVHLAIVEKAISESKKSLEEMHEDMAIDFFADRIKSNQFKTTFTAVSGDCSADFQFRKRGFSDDIAEKLDGYNIPYDSETGDECYIINPDILKNQDLLKKLAVALKELKGFESTPIVQCQKGKRKNSFNDETLAGIVKLKGEERSMLLKSISTMALAQAKVEGADAKNESIVTKCLTKLSQVGLLKLASTKKVA